MKARTFLVLYKMSAIRRFCWILTYELAPQKILALFENVQLAQWQILLIINGAMFTVGCFMESLAVMIMAVPVMLPFLKHARVDLVHFGIFFVLNVMISAITPPAGTITYVVCGLNKISIVEFAKEVWPFIIALVIPLLILT